MAESLLAEALYQPEFSRDYANELLVTSLVHATDFLVTQSPLQQAMIDAAQCQVSAWICQDFEKNDRGQEKKREKDNWVDRNPPKKGSDERQERGNPPAERSHGNDKDHNRDRSRP